MAPDAGIASLADIEALLDRAARTALVRPAIAALAASAPASALRVAFERALAERGPAAATALAFTVGVAGGTVPAGPLGELLADLEHVALFAPLVAIADGDRVALLLGFLRDGHASWEREALACLLATHFLAGRPAPAELASHLRMLARKPLEAGTGVVVGLALRALGEPSVAPLVARLLPPAPESEYDRMAAAILEALPTTPLDALPEHEPVRVVSGFTLVRTIPKVGRNDHCPCGSGKKYKRCCAEQHQARALRESAAERFAQLDERYAAARDQLFEQLRPSELAQQDPARLTSLQLIRGARRLADHRRWDAAERFLAALDTRADAPEPASGYLLDVADEALSAGDLDVAERIFRGAAAEADEGEREEFLMRLTLARGEPDALARVEGFLTAAFRAGDSGRMIACAHALLAHAPALGILAARGAVTAERPLDSEVLLEETERARDRLLIDPYEPWWAVLDLLAGQQARAAEHEADEHALARERDRLRDEIDRLRGALREADATATSLQRDLAARRQELERVAAERARLDEIVRAVREDDAAQRLQTLEVDRARLRKAVTDLEHAIEVGGAERAELRRALRKAAEPARRTPSASPSADPCADDGEPAGLGPPRRVLLPGYAPAATKALAALPRAVAAHALRVVAALAGGDPLVWAGVKRMRSAAQTYSARVGRGHRLLFSLDFDADRLDVTAVIDRKDLESSLRRC